MLKIYVGFVQRGNDESDFIAKLKEDESLENHMKKKYGEDCKYSYSEIDEELAAELNII